MKITGIKEHQVNLPLKEGSLSWSDGSFVEVFDNTVVAEETDVGLTGYGECRAPAPAYLRANARGVRSRLAEIAPKAVGLDPRDLAALNRYMDAVLMDHSYIRSAIEVACWDNLGKATGPTVYTLLCEKAQQDVAFHRSISKTAPEGMATNVACHHGDGCSKFHLKKGSDASAIITKLAHSTPDEFCFPATDFISYGTVDIAEGAPRRFNGRMRAPEIPGLGITPILLALADPVLDTVRA